MLYLPIGKYATTPYYLEELGVGIHTIEELSYFLRENAASLEDGIMRLQLCTFIEKELEMPKLGTDLRELVANKGSLASFVRLILEASGYVSVEEMRSIESLLRQTQSLGTGERRKTQGDYHLFAGRYLMAEREYRQALEQLDKRADREQYAACCHNLGCALAGMFLYDRAAECFLEAYELGHEEESYIQYLAALRLGNSKTAYTQKVNELSLKRGPVAELERRLEEIAKDSKKSSERTAMEEIGNAFEEGDAGTVMQKTLSLINSWKADYRADTEID